jgi:hypothetical protein
VEAAVGDLVEPGPDADIHLVEGGELGAPDKIQS